MGDTLFAEVPWDQWRDYRKLNELVTKAVIKFPGRNRKDLRELFIQENFAQFTQSEINNAVNALVESQRIICTTPIKSPQLKTKRLNDKCVLEPCP